MAQHQMRKIGDQAADRRDPNGEAAGLKSLKVPTEPIRLPPETDLVAQIIRDPRAKDFFTKHPSLLNTFRTPENLELPGERLVGAVNPDQRLIDKAAKAQKGAFVSYCEKFLEKELGKEAYANAKQADGSIKLQREDVARLEKLGMAGAQRDIYAARYLFSSGVGSGTGSGLFRENPTAAERAEYKQQEHLKQERQSQALRAREEASERAWHERYQAAALKIRQDPNSLYNDPSNEVARREKFEANLNLMMGKPIDPMMRGVPGVNGAANWQATNREPILTLPSTSDVRLVSLQQKFDRTGVLPPAGSIEGEAVLQLLAARRGGGSQGASLDERRREVLFGASLEVGSNYGKTLSGYAVTRLETMTSEYFTKVGNSLDEKLIPYVSRGSGALTSVESQKALNQARLQMMQDFVASTFDPNTGVASSYRSRGEAGLQAYAKGIVQLEKTIEGEKSFSRSEKNAIQLKLQAAAKATPDVQAAYLQEKEKSFVSDVMTYVAQGKSKGMSTAYFTQVGETFEKHFPDLPNQQKAERRDHMLRTLQSELRRENSPLLARIDAKERMRLERAVESALSTAG